MNILALSPHTDDIELGCGGCLSKLSKAGHDIYVICFNLRSEHEASLAEIGVKENWLLDFKTRDFNRQNVLDILIEAKKRIKPHFILTPNSNDIHQDHEVVHNETKRAFRGYSILGYELPWNSRGFAPQYYIPLDIKHLDHKWDMIKSYESQSGRSYYNYDYICSVAKMRGQQIGRKYAEAFEAVTLIMT